MLATLTDQPFSNPDWLYEIKWDGYRIEAVVDDGKVRLWTRNGKDGETYFPGLLSPPSWIDAQQAIVDGEVVALDENGRPDFGLLQERISRAAAAAATGRQRRQPARDAPLVYQVFDLLYLDGRSLAGRPARGPQAPAAQRAAEQPRVRSPRTSTATAGVLRRRPRERHLEGDHRQASPQPLRAGPTDADWLKVKVRPEQELVVGGYLPGEGTHTELGAVLVGVYEDGALRYAGRVGSGFDTQTRRSSATRLDKL